MNKEKTRLEIDDDVYQMLVERVRLTQPRYDDEPNLQQITVTLNDIAREYFEEEEEEEEQV